MSKPPLPAGMSTKRTLGRRGLSDGARVFAMWSNGGLVAQASAAGRVDSCGPVRAARAARSAKPAAALDAGRPAAAAARAKEEPRDEHHEPDRAA
jgi:hypothetical protein